MTDTTTMASKQYPRSTPTAGDLRLPRRLAVAVATLLAIGLTLTPTFSSPVSADCAMSTAADAIETADIVFIGVPVEPVGEPADDGFAGAQLWRFDVLEVAKGTLGLEALVVYDNWYVDLSESEIGNEVVVIANEYEGELRAAGCVERLSPQELRDTVDVLGLELSQPDPDVPVGTAPAPEDVEEPEPTDDESSQSDADSSTGTLRAVGIVGALLLAGGAVFAYARRS